MSMLATGDSIRLPIGLAGTGVFARKAHRQAICGSNSAYLAAVFGRSLPKARSLVEGLSVPPDSVECFDDYPAFLASHAFPAVDLVLPTPIISAAVRSALVAGKHVLSEKPIASSSADARRLIAFWNSMAPRPAWLVCENWRLERAFIEGRRLLDAGSIGDLLRARCVCLIRRTDHSEYHSSDWRRRQGWLLDVGVHVIAVLGVLFGPVVSVPAATVNHRSDSRSSIRAHLSFADAPQCEATFEHEIVGDRDSFDIRVDIVGTLGQMQVSRHQLSVAPDASSPRVMHFESMTVNDAVQYFADVVHGRSPLGALDPQLALSDLVAIERIQAHLQELPSHE